MQKLSKKLTSKQKMSKKTLTIFGALFGITGAGIFAYLWMDFINRGMRADEQHIGGYTTVLDGVTVIVMITLMIGSITCFRLIKDMSSTYKRRLLIATCIVVVTVFLITTAYTLIRVY